MSRHYVPDEVVEWFDPNKGRLSPIRDWVSPSGSRCVALHPLLIALNDYYAPNERLVEFDEFPNVRFTSALRLVLDRLVEMARGERRLPAQAAVKMLEVDRSQRACGCPDEHVDRLAVLLGCSGETVSRTVADFGGDAA